MVKTKITHTLTLGGHQVGEGIEDAKKGCIELRLHPSIRLSWEDNTFDIRLTRVVGNRIKSARGKK